jgi:hypothetical protein
MYTENIVKHILRLRIYMYWRRTSQNTNYICLDFKGFWRWCVRLKISSSLPISKGPNLVDVFPPSPEDGNRPSFRVCRKSDDRKTPKSQ